MRLPNENKTLIFPKYMHNTLELSCQEYLRTFQQRRKLQNSINDTNDLMLLHDNDRTEIEETLMYYASRKAIDLAKNGMIL